MTVDLVLLASAGVGYRHTVRANRRL